MFENFGLQTTSKSNTSQETRMNLFQFYFNTLVISLRKLPGLKLHLPRLLRMYQGKCPIPLMQFASTII